MVIRPELQCIQYHGMFLRKGPDVLISGILIYKPQGAWIESGTPPPDVGSHKFPVRIRITRTFSFFKIFVQKYKLFCRPVENPVCKGLHGLFFRARAQNRAQRQHK